MALKIGLVLLQTTIIFALPQQQGPNVIASGYGSAPTSSAPSSGGYGGGGGSYSSGGPSSNGTQQPSSSSSPPGYGGSGFNNGPGYVNPGQSTTPSSGYGQQSSTPSYGGGTTANTTTSYGGTNTSTTSSSNTGSNTTSSQCSTGPSGCNPRPQCGQPGQANNPACATSTTPSYGGSTPTPNQYPNYPSDSQAYGVPGHTPGVPIGPIFTDPNQPSTCAQQNPSHNRDLVIKAHQQVFGDRNPQNINNYFAESYIEHDPSSPDGRNAIADTLKNNTVTPQRFPFLRTCADRDLVWVHNRVELRAKVFATVDIYRIECGVIKEHWVVRQDTTLTEMSKNSHPFF